MLSPYQTVMAMGMVYLIAGETDKNVVALSADLADSTKTSLFKNKFPDRFVQMGIGEQSMASVASGLAAMGKIPFFTSYAMFSPEGTGSRYEPQYVTTM